MNATTSTTTAPSTAAHLEDILSATVTDELVYTELVELHAQEAILKARIDELKSELRDSMTSRGAQAITDRAGKVIARISEVHTSRVDRKRLFADFPEIAKALAITTKTSRLAITWPKR
jgi:hypothetical protein